MPSTGSVTSRYNWPGWPLSANPYESDFDEKARERMVKGGEELLPLLEKHSHKIGQRLLEAGPFFNPLVTPERFPNKAIVYLDNDLHTVLWLKEKKQGTVVYCDLNSISEFSAPEKFDTLVASQILNYIDYKKFLYESGGFLNPGGLLFINNVVDYGIPALFSRKRPLSIEETISQVEVSGYQIVEKKVLVSPDPDSQENPRLLLVGEKI